MLSSTDRNDLVTENLYDLRGQQIQTRSEVRDTRNPTPETRYLVSRTFYDPKGRAVVTGSSFVENQLPGKAFDNSTATTASFSVYDGADRVVESYQLKDVVLAVVARPPTTAPRSAWAAPCSRPLPARLTASSSSAP